MVSAWWIVLAVLVSGVGGFWSCAVLVSGKQDDLRRAIYNAFDLGHETGRRGIIFSIAHKTFLERFGDL